MSNSEASFHMRRPGLRRSHEEALQKNRLLAILTEILKKKAFDACDSFAAAAGVHHPFLQRAIS
jgi:hypothetical protein